MNWESVVKAILAAGDLDQSFGVFCHPDRVEEVREAVSREPWADRVTVFSNLFCFPDQFFLAEGVR